jgi:hypothetical protein
MIMNYERRDDATEITPETAAHSANEQGSVYFIGNATTLIRFGALTILTDPTFIHMHEQVSIGYGMHSTRLANPAIDIGRLPSLDLVLLSHFHGDHFDQVAERELDKSLPIVTTPHAARELQELASGTRSLLRHGRRGLHRWIDLVSRSQLCPAVTARLCQN